LKYHLIGICGTGMGAVAGLLRDAGHEVRGSDSGIYPPMSDLLRSLEIPVMEPFAPQNLDWKPDVVVVGNVCHKDHVEVLRAQELGLTLVSMAQVLEDEFLVDRASVVVAGTHGKTTSSSLLAHVLDSAGRDPGFFIGGVARNFGRSFRVGTGPEFVVEGDEYDTAFFDKKAKFFHYRPRYVLLTSVEFDHADIYDSYEVIVETFGDFVAMIPEDGLLVAHSSVPGSVVDRARCPVWRYDVSGINEGRSGHGSGIYGKVGLRGGGAARSESGLVWNRDAASVSATRQREDSDAFLATGAWVATVVPERSSATESVFQIHTPEGEFVGTFRVPIPGRHNVANALGCLLIAYKLGLDRPEMSRALASFQGVRRRQEFKGVAQGVVVLDDFAHHPTAVRETLAALKGRFGDGALIAVFEPRSNTARRNIFQRKFAEALSGADRVVIAPPYGVEKLPEDQRLDVDALADEIRALGAPARALGDVDAIVEHLAATTRPGDTVVTMSSGSFGGIHRKLLLRIGDAIFPAGSEDIEELAQLLDKLHLDGDDLAANFDDYLVLRVQDGLAGCIGMEIHGPYGLVKDMAVAPSRQGEGWGWMLGQSALQRASRLGLERVFMFGTRSTKGIGQVLGFKVCDKDEVPGFLRDSPQFARAVHRNAEHMCIKLYEDR